MENKIRGSYDMRILGIQGLSEIPEVFLHIKSHMGRHGTSAKCIASQSI